MNNHPTKILNRWFVVCLCTQFLYCMAFFMSTPLIAQHLLNLGQTEAVAGFVAGLFSILGLVCRPIAGFATDALSRKHMVMFGLVLYVIAFFGYGLVESVPWIVFFRIINAIGLAFLTTAISVLATQFIPEERMGEGVGYVTTANVLATALGPTVGVICMNHFSCQTTFIFSGVILVLAVFVICPLPSNKKGKFSVPSSLKLSDFFCKSAIPLAACAGMFTYCAGMTTSFLVAVGTERGIATVSVFFIISSLGAVVIRPIAGKMVDKKSLGSVLSISFISEAICMIAVAFASSTVGIIVASLGRTFGQLVAQTTLQGQVMKDTPDEHRGVASSTFYMGIDLGQGLGPIIGGTIAGISSYQTMYLSGLGALVCGVVIFCLYAKHKKQKA